MELSASSQKGDFHDSYINSTRDWEQIKVLNEFDHKIYHVAA